MAQNRTPRTNIARAIAEKLITEPSERAHWIQAAAAYLVAHDMEDQIDALVNDIAYELYRQKRVLNVSVSSARPLTDTTREELTSYLRNETEASEVILHESIDASLLGGLVARTPDGELDVSVRTKLKQLAALA